MNKALKTVSGMFVIMMAAKLLGQLREIMLAGYYGTGEGASAFLVASQIPLNFFDMVFGFASFGVLVLIAVVTAVIATFLPVYNAAKKKPVDSIRST